MAVFFPPLQPGLESLRVQFQVHREQLAHAGLFELAAMAAGIRQQVPGDRSLDAVLAFGLRLAGMLQRDGGEGSRMLRLS